MATHFLKTWPVFFWPLRDGTKTAEVWREDDRTFAVDDILILEEWNPETHMYSGRRCTRRVSHIVRGQPWLPDGMVILSLQKIEED